MLQQKYAGVHFEAQHLPARTAGAAANVLPPALLKLQLGSSQSSGAYKYTVNDDRKQTTHSQADMGAAAWLKMCSSALAGSAARPVAGPRALLPAPPASLPVLLLAANSRVRAAALKSSGQ